MTAKSMRKKKKCGISVCLFKLNLLALLYSTYKKYKV